MDQHARCNATRLPSPWLGGNLSGVTGLQRRSIRHCITILAHERLEIAALAIIRVGKRTMA